MTPAHFQGIITPLILGVASLIALVSLRDINISERIRSADAEASNPATLPERRRNLVQQQIRALKRRYFAVNTALLLLMIAFVAFVVMGVLSDLSLGGATTAFVMGAALAFAGFLLLFYEVFTARQSLFADTAYVEALWKEQETAAAQDKLPAVDSNIT